MHENRALWLSISGNLVCVFLGFGFAVMTNSGAILLDGFYSLISLVVALLAQRISRLVERPPDERMPFGYAHFEPIFNTLRSLLIISGSVYALISSLGVVMAGGHVMEYGMAVVYGVVCTTLCFVIARYQHVVARRIVSPIISVDARSWTIDGLITLMTTIAFFLGLLLKNGRFSAYVPYIDPVLVMVLVIMILPVPLRMLGSNIREALQFAASSDIQQSVRERLQQILSDVPAERTDIRVMKSGRYIYVTIYELIPDDSRDIPLYELDEIRGRVMESFEKSKWRYFIDLIFTMDAKGIW